MDRKFALYTVGLAVTISLAGCLQDDPMPVAGTRISVADFSDQPSRSRVIFSSDDAAHLSVPAAQSLGDPTMHGGSVTLSNPQTGEFDAYNLPAANWTALPEPEQGYRYVDVMHEDGPCEYVSVTANTRLVAICRGAEVQFSLNAPTQGAIAIDVILGSFGGTRYCAVFGGHVMRDAPSSPGHPGSFLAMNAPAPTACDLVS